MVLDKAWEQLFWASFEHSTSAMELLNEGRRRVAVNDAFCSQSGRERDELIGTLLEDVVAAESRPYARAGWNHLQEHGEWVGSWLVERPDGKRIHAQVAGVFTKLGVERRALFVCLECVPADDQEAVGDRGPLTGREREVVNLVSHGHSNAEIAVLLSVAPSTIKTHVENAMGKLEARTRAHLVALVMTGALGASG